MALENTNIEKDELSLKELILIIKELIGYLKTKSTILLLLAVIGIIVGYGTVYKTNPVYNAKLTFAFEDDKGSGSSGGLGGALGIASSLGIDLGSSGGGAFSAANISALIKSRLVVENTLFKPLNVKGQKTTLLEYYFQLYPSPNKKQPFKEIFNNILLSQDSGRREYTREQDSIMQGIIFELSQNNLKITQKDKKVTILTIEVENENEEFAKLFCENLAKEVSDFYIETKSKKAKTNVNILQRQSDSIKKELDISISTYARAADDVFNLNPANNIKSSITKKSQIDLQTNTAILSQITAQLELAKLTLRKETPLLQIIDKPSFPLGKYKPSKLKAIILGLLISVVVGSIFLILIRKFKQLTS